GRAARPRPGAAAAELGRPALTAEEDRVAGHAPLGFDPGCDAELRDLAVAGVADARAARSFLQPERRRVGRGAGEQVAPRAARVRDPEELFEKLADLLAEPGEVVVRARPVARPPGQVARRRARRRGGRARRSTEALRS